MPEATVDEDDGFPAGENEVRLPRQVFAVEAKSVTAAMNQLADEELGLGVQAPYGAHIGASAGR
jgi:hypothetical protein